MANTRYPFYPLVFGVRNYQQKSINALVTAFEIGIVPVILAVKYTSGKKFGKMIQIQLTIFNLSSSITFSFLPVNIRKHL